MDFSAQLSKIAHFFDEMGDFCILGVFFYPSRMDVLSEIVNMKQRFVKW